MRRLAGTTTTENQNVLSGSSIGTLYEAAQVRVRARGMNVSGAPTPAVPACKIKYESGSVTIAEGTINQDFADNTAIAAATAGQPVSLALTEDDTIFNGTIPAGVQSMQFSGISGAVMWEYIVF